MRIYSKRNNRNSNVSRLRNKKSRKNIKTIRRVNRRINSKRLYKGGSNSPIAPVLDPPETDPNKAETTYKCYKNFDITVDMPNMPEEQIETFTGTKKNLLKQYSTKPIPPSTKPEYECWSPREGWLGNQNPDYLVREAIRYKINIIKAAIIGNTIAYNNFTYNKSNWLNDDKYARLLTKIYREEITIAMEQGKDILQEFKDEFNQNGYSWSKEAESQLLNKYIEGGGNKTNFPKDSKDPEVPKDPKSENPTMGGYRSIRSRRKYYKSGRRNNYRRSRRSKGRGSRKKGSLIKSTRDVAGKTVGVAGQVVLVPVKVASKVVTGVAKGAVKTADKIILNAENVIKGKKSVLKVPVNLVKGTVNLGVKTVKGTIGVAKGALNNTTAALSGKKRRSNKRKPKK